MTVNNAHAYCDESGNTGANLLDPIQPLFVVGGWFVLDNLKEAADEVVKGYIRFLKPRDNELHGIRLLKSEIGTSSIFNLVQDLYKLYCGPICQICEKRILLVGHIFDVFLKPRFNLNVPNSFEDHWEGKRELVEKVYSLPDDILAEFAKAYDTLDRSLLLDSLQNITTVLAERSDTELANLMEGSKSHINAIIEHNRIGRAQYDSITMNTPNVASFHMFFQSIEHMGRLGKVPKITLVHDESPQFEKAFPRIFEESRDDPRNYSFKEGPHSVVYRGFESLQDFRFANSKKEPLLQAADVVVSAMHRYAMNVYKDVPNSSALTKIARVFLEEDDEKPSIIRTTLSDWFVDKLYDSINKP
ncbi:DUF3800 domain-containing protein [Chloroflexota bacterium]